MLRVSFILGVFLMVPQVGASTGDSGIPVSDDISLSTHWWMSEVAQAPDFLKRKLDGTRSRLIDSSGLRKALKGGKAVIRDVGDEGKAREKIEENTEEKNDKKEEVKVAADVPAARPSVAPVPAPRVEPPAPKVKPRKKAPTRPKTEKYNFEFAKAEIMDVVKAISNITGKNFIIPDKIKSQRITILSPTPISEREAYQVFLAALEINGVTIVRMGKFLKLVNSKAAVKKTIPTCIGPNDVCPEYSDQMVTRLIHLENIEAGQITAVLKSLMGKGGTLTTFQPSNALIISEYASNLTRMLRILKALDVPGFDDELRMVQIEYATAAEIANKLTQIFDVKAKGRGASRSKSSKKLSKAGEGDGGEVQISKIIADERTNQLIIKANKRSFKAIKQLIAKLDVPISEAEQGRVHVYYLDNAKAEDLASTLSSLAQGNSGSKARKGRKKGKASPSNQSAVLFEGEVKITADKATNALIIIASAHDYRSLRKLIEKLDRARRQVYVEAAILEVTTSSSEDASLDWHTPGRFSKADIGDTFGGGNTVGFLQSGPFSPNAMGGISPTLSPAGLIGMAGGSLAGIVGKGFTLPGTDVSLPSFGVLLHWLQKDSNTQVLSTPHILTMDNEEANIEVGKKVPFQRGVMSGGGSLGSALGGSSGLASALGGLGGMGGLGGFAQTDRIDVKLKLSLTPQITGNNRVRLEVDQQVEDIIAGEGSAGTPTTSSQSVKSVVVMDDQQTVVLGGLMRDRVIESESKVPILGDLPLLGWFFKSKKSQVEKVNLLLVLTPYIVESTEDFQKILERKMGEHEEFSADYYGNNQKYRAHIDYSKKSGPLALLGAAAVRESEKIENGGDGGDEDNLVSPGPVEELEESSLEEGETSPVAMEEEFAPHEKVKVLKSVPPVEASEHG